VVPAPPARLQIPRIDLDQRILPVGLDAKGQFVVLKHDIAWYRRSGKPGAGTSTVLWAHVLRWKQTPHIPAPFERVHQLRRGDRISITAEGGTRFDYVVTYQLRITPNAVEYIAPTPLERLVLVSCIGKKVIVGGVVTLEERLITIAEPVD
jgi:sortase (surface protein transpeptidase)